jgi:hypothetical protein
MGTTKNNFYNEKENKIMAREKMVTRTIDITEGTFMCMDVCKCETLVRTIDINGKFVNKNDLLNRAKELYELEDFKIVFVQSMNYKEVLMGMSEIDFIRHAKVLPPRTPVGTRPDTPSEAE